MSVRRALVDCAVLSLQDPRVYYPCCKCCFSRIDTDQQDATRCRCFRCGYSCVREQADYRYRLSLKVARDRSIFGVTVFGTCLNSFFGIHAGGLQRLVHDIDGTVDASTRSTLLAKAVEDCFIGRHFIFGLKVTGAENDLWSGGSVAGGSNCRATVQFIATQMILPKATEHTGCTVLSYYRVLLQKAEEHEFGSTDASKSSRPPITSLLLIPVHSPDRTSNNTTLSASAFLSQSLQRSQHQDCSLSHTPPWEQSLGLITSSAEQDEGFSAQEGGDESRGYSKAAHLAPRSCLENRDSTEETTLSPPHSFNCLSFTTYPDLSIVNSVVSTPTLDRWSSPSHAVRKASLLRCTSKELSSTRLTKTFLSSSLAWDDLPFSESLTQFLGENQNVSQTKPPPNDQNAAEPARNRLENGSVNRRQNSRESRLLADITNASAGKIHHSSDGARQNSVGRVKPSEANEWSRRDAEGSSLSFQELLDGESYNCSADLFSSSFAIDTEVKGDKCPSKDDLIPPVSREQDFTPPSQSTPNVKATFGWRLSSRLGKFGPHFFLGSPPALGSERTSAGCKLKADRHRSTPEGGPWKPDGRRRCPPAQQRRSVGRGAPNLEPNKRTRQYEDNEVPPTPAAETQPSRDHSIRSGSTCEGQPGDGVQCTLSRRDSDGEVTCAGGSDPPGGCPLRLRDEEQPSDCSRDLFSDSL